MLRDLIVYTLVLALTAAGLVLCLGLTLIGLGELTRLLGRGINWIERRRRHGG